MTFLTPLLAGVAAGIAVPSLVILYFLKLRRRDLEISTTLLWKKSIQDLQANAPFQKLRRNILLLLQLLALGAALFAIAQPQLSSRDATGASHVILIDRSASMSSLDPGDGRSRLDLAKSRALELVDSLAEPGPLGTSPGERAMVIAFDTTAHVRQTFTADKGLLRSAIRGIEATDGGSSITEAVALARAHAPRRSMTETGADGSPRTIELPSGPVGTIHVFSDGCVRGVERVDLHAEDVVEYHAIGEPGAANVGITSLRATRAYDAPETLVIFAAIESTDAATRSVDVEVFIDDAAAGVRTIEVPGAALGEGDDPGSMPRPGTIGVSIPMQRPQGGVVTVRLRHPDSAAVDQLLVDDVAWLVVPPARRLKVAVVTDGDLFLTAAMQGLSLEKLDTLTPDAFAAALKDGSWTDFDAVVLDGWLPEDRALPPGKWIVLGATPSMPGVSIGDEVKGARIVRWKQDHPVLRGVDLDPLFIGSIPAISIAPDSQARTLATSDAGPAIIELDSGGVRAVVAPFDVAESTLPFTGDLVVLLANALAHLGDDGSAAVASSVKPGGELVDRLPPGTAEAFVAQPGGARTRVIPAPDGRVVFGPVPRVGVYVLTWGAGSTRAYTANLLDESESDIRAAGEIPLASRDVAAETSGRAAAIRKLWPWLILGALGVLLLEWFVYNRKVHV